MILFAAAAGVFETNVVHWTGEFVLAVAWLAVVLSIDRAVVLADPPFSGHLGAVFVVNRRAPGRNR